MVSLSNKAASFAVNKRDGRDLSGVIPNEPSGKANFSSWLLKEVIRSFWAEDQNTSTKAQYGNHTLALCWLIIFIWNPLKQMDEKLITFKDWHSA